MFSIRVDEGSQQRIRDTADWAFFLVGLFLWWVGGWFMCIYSMSGLDLGESMAGGWE